MKTLERQLAEYSEYQSEVHGPISVDEVTNRPLRFSGQTRIRATRPVWIAMTAAAAALVLIGGVAWIALSQRSDSPPFITQPQAPTVTTLVDETDLEESPTDGDAVELEEPPPLAVDLPPGAESSTIETPLGTATWVHVSGDPGTLPGDGQALAWPSGFAIFESPSRFWVSGDGIEWRVEPLAVPPAAEDASISLADGVYWLISSEGVWRSTDGATWDQVDPGGSIPPGPLDLFKGAWYTAPVTGGGVTISYAVSEWGLEMGDYLPFLIDDYEPGGADEEGCRSLLELEPTVFQIFGGRPGNEGPPCPHSLALRFEETETGLRVLDNATGQELDRILGANIGHIKQIAQVGDGDGVVEKDLLIIDGDEIAQIEVPWPEQSSEVLYGTQDAVFAFVSDRATGQQFSVWRTTDGHTWTDLGPPSFLPTIAQPVWTDWTALPGSLVVTVKERSSVASCASQGLRCAEFVVAWETTDGIAWRQESLEGRPDPSYPVRLESGWFANDGPKGDDSEGDWWMHIDGTWVSLADLGIDLPDPTTGSLGCRVLSEAVDQTTFLRRGSGPDCSTTDLWVLSLDP